MGKLFCAPPIDGSVASHADSPAGYHGSEHDVIAAAGIPLLAEDGKAACFSCFTAEIIHQDAFGPDAGHPDGLVFCLLPLGELVPLDATPESNRRDRDQKEQDQERTRLHLLEKVNARGFIATLPCY